MIVKLIKQVMLKKTKYKYLPFSYCCEQMQNCPDITLTDMPVVEGYVSNKKGKLVHTDKEGTIIPYFAIKHTESVYNDYWKYTVNTDYYYPLSVCPFCGEKFEFSLFGIKNLTKFTKNLYERKKTLTARYNNADNQMDKRLDGREETFREAESPI